MTVVERDIGWGEQQAAPAARRPLPVRELTARQTAILRFIERFICEHGYAPTMREIGAAFRIRSTNGVHDHLRAIQRKGYISVDSWKSRAIRVLRNVPPAPGAAEVDLCPHCGQLMPDRS